MQHLYARLEQNCNWLEEQGETIPHKINAAYVTEMLKKRIAQLDIDAAKRDIDALISDAQVLDLWSKAFFMEIVKQLSYR